MKKRKADPSNVAWVLENLDPDDKGALKGFHSWLQSHPESGERWDIQQDVKKTWQRIFERKKLH